MHQLQSKTEAGSHMHTWRQPKHFTNPPARHPLEARLDTAGLNQHRQHTSAATMEKPDPHFVSSSGFQGKPGQGQARRFSRQAQTRISQQEISDATSSASANIEDQYFRQAEPSSRSIRPQFQDEQDEKWDNEFLAIRRLHINTR